MSVHLSSFISLLKLIITRKDSKENIKKIINCNHPFYRGDGICSVNIMRLIVESIDRKSLGAQRFEVRGKVIKISFCESRYDELAKEKPRLLLLSSHYNSVEKRLYHCDYVIACSRLKLLGALKSLKEELIFENALSYSGDRKLIIIARNINWIFRHIKYTGFTCDIKEKRVVLEYDFFSGVPHFNKHCSFVHRR